MHLYLSHRVSVMISKFEIRWIIVTGRVLTRNLGGHGGMGPKSVRANKPRWYTADPSKLNRVGIVNLLY